jgi:hypothetical protein
MIIRENDGDELLKVILTNILRSNKSKKIAQTSTAENLIEQKKV